MFDIEIIVYHDENYPSAWLEKSKGVPSRIASFFQQRGYPILNAVQLRKLIISSLELQEAHKKIIVFSQDVVPDTICEESHANTLFREYLDAGGNVVWLGDIPLFYIGENNGNRQDAWKSGAPVYMLGIVPIFASTKRSVDITSLGRHLGLFHHWTSSRPVLNDETINPLAFTKNIGSDYFINIPKAPGKLGRLWNNFRRIESLGLPGGFSFRMGPSSQAGQDSNVRSVIYETHVSAWKKNYNIDFPCTGFFRIFDYLPRILPDWRLMELASFSINISKNIKEWLTLWN